MKEAAIVRKLCAEKGTVIVTALERDVEILVNVKTAKILQNDVYFLVWSPKIDENKME